MTRTIRKSPWPVDVDAPWQVHQSLYGERASVIGSYPTEAEARRAIDRLHLQDRRAELREVALTVVGARSRAQSAQAMNVANRTLIRVSSRLAAVERQLAGDPGGR